MKDHVRDMIAAVAFAHHSGSLDVQPIYSHSESRDRQITGSISGISVDAYDHDNSEQHLSGKLPELFHDGESDRINLQSDGFSGYRGYHYGTEERFEIHIDNDGLSFRYNGKHFNYVGRKPKQPSLIPTLKRDVLRKFKSKK